MDICDEKPFLCILMIWIMKFANSGSLPPSRPIHVTLSADPKNIFVQWEPPVNTYGTIRQYIIGWSILPEISDIVSVNYVDGHVNTSLIPVGEDVGRVFRIRVRAVNDVRIGAYSISRYIRPGCGKDIILMGNTNTSINFPSGENAVLKPRVICSRKIRTQEKFTIIFHLDLINLPKNQSLCENIFVNITGYGSLCDSRSSINKTLVLNTINTTIILRTGHLIEGSGYISFNVSSIPRLPGPPTHITTRSHDHGIAVAWQPPIENTFKITSYEIQYSIVSLRTLYKVAVGSSMRQFFVNTDKFEGKLLQFNILAIMGQKQGQMSRSYFVRAACHKEVYVKTGTIYNITSPWYPAVYPSDIICTWSVVAEHQEPGTMLHVTFLDFQLEESLYCSKDFVMFSFKSTQEPECKASQIPFTLITDKQNFTLKFVTDNTHQYRGFFIQVQTIETILTPIPNTEMNTFDHSSSTESVGKTALRITTTSLLTPTTQAKTFEHVYTDNESRNTHTYSTSELSSSSKTTLDRPYNNSVMKITNPQPEVSVTSTEHTNVYADNITNIPDIKAKTESSTTKLENTTDTALSTIKPEIRTNKPAIKPKPNIYTTNTQSIAIRSTTKESESTSITKPLSSTTTSSTKKTIQTYLPTRGRATIAYYDHGRTLTSVSEKLNRMDKVLGQTTHSSPQAQGEREITRPVITVVDATLIVVGGTCVTLTVVAIVICRRRQKLHRMRVHSELTSNKVPAHVELHNILEQGKSNSSLKQGQMVVKGTNNQLNNSTKSCNVEKRGTIPTAWGSNRARHNSFPLAHYIKINKQMNKVLKTFSFIEDQQALQTNLQRKRRLRRTNSF